MSLVVSCTDPTIVAGQTAADCPAASLVLKEETAFWDPALSLADVSDLLGAVFITLAIAWGFKFLFNQLTRR